MNTIAVKIIALIVLIGVGFAAGVGWEHRARVAEVAKLEAKYSQQQTARQDVGIQAQKVEDTKQDTQIAAVAKIDTQRTQELTNEKAAIDAQRPAVASGAERVRIIARCPARDPGSNPVPSPSPAASVGDATPVELAPADGQVVLDLKAAIAEDQTKILTLQDYIRTLQPAP